MRLRTVAFSNLRRRKSRAAFLVAGLLVGIGTVVALLTLSQALTVQAQNNLETYGANIIVAPRTDGLSLSYGGVTVAGVSVGAAGHPARPTWRASRRSPTAGTSPIVAPELLGAVSVERPAGPAHGRAARERVRPQEVVERGRAAAAERPRARGRLGRRGRAQACAPAPPSAWTAGRSPSPASCVRPAPRTTTC